MEAGSRIMWGLSQVIDIMYILVWHHLLRNPRLEVFDSVEPGDILDRVNYRDALDGIICALRMANNLRSFGWTWICPPSAFAEEDIWDVLWNKPYLEEVKLLVSVQSHSPLLLENGIMTRLPITATFNGLTAFDFNIYCSLDEVPTTAMLGVVDFLVARCPNLIAALSTLIIAKVASGRWPNLQILRLIHARSALQLNAHLVAQFLAFHSSLAALEWTVIPFSDQITLTLPINSPPILETLPLKRLLGLRLGIDPWTFDSDTDMAELLSIDKDNLTAVKIEGIESMDDLSRLAALFPNIEYLDLYGMNDRYDLQGIDAPRFDLLPKVRNFCFGGGLKLMEMYLKEELATALSHFLNLRVVVGMNLLSDDEPEDPNEMETRIRQLASFLPHCDFFGHGGSSGIEIVRSEGEVVTWRESDLSHFADGFWSASRW
ncbi:hypothetical protein BU17DRAFT_68591 [Hysterangium stoloniferum]|nr:hypothetical protein BU17DRAFT_68591 [Hysterangium stoloniferum]